MELESIDPAIIRFAFRMQSKLDKNKHKDSNRTFLGQSLRWAGCDLFWLLKRLRKEVTELKKAIQAKDTESIKDEAADVANFAMMIFDNLTAP